MTQLTTTPEGFRTAAYLAARARLDAARSRSRSGKTSRRVSCNPPNVRCGGRCIPPAWDCRLKGEGPDPQLRAVKTDPLSGFANIQRGVQRITKGVTRGNLSEVQGGRAAIIRGVVKTVPGDIQQKKQLKTTLENRTRAIGIGLAVVTTGLGMHAILMKSNLYGYNKGWGKDINQATRAGVSRVLDSIPVLGAQRRATRAAVGANLGAAAARASAPAMSTSAIPGTTVLSATDRESHSALQQSLNKINGATRSGAAGTSGNLENWNQKHNTAFWSATRKSDITGVGAPARVSIYAEPTAQEYLGKQFGVPPGERSSRSGVKAALQARFDEERRGLVSLAKQQGLRVRSGPNGDTIDSKDINAFVSGVMRSRPIADTAARQSVEAHVRSVLTKAPSSYTNEVYNASVLSFDSFYKATSRDIRTIPGAAATTGRRIATPLSTGSNELLRNTNTYRSTYLAGEMRARTQMAGPAHTELVQAAYYHTKVAGTNASSYTIPDRLAFNAASELSGRPVTSRSEAIGIINRETGFSGARVAGAAAPRQRGASAQASLSSLARSIRARAGNENMSMEASLRQARAEIARRGDSADLPPRIAAYLELRNDFVAGKKGLGKPCGESHIPKAHECNIGKGKMAPPETGKRSNTGAKVAVAAALVGAAALGGRAAFKNRQNIPMYKNAAKYVDKGIKTMSSTKVRGAISKLPVKFQEPANKLVGKAKVGLAFVAADAQGMKLTKVDPVNNFSTFKNPTTGHVMSVGAVDDTLVTFVSTPSGKAGSFDKFGIAFQTDLSFDQKQGLSKAQGLGVSKQVKSMFSAQLDEMPENAVLFNNPYKDDGLGDKRSAIYKRFKFTELPGVRGGNMWALKNQGKLTKIPPEQADYVARLIRGDAADTRVDLKCGKGAISEGEKCTKGAATKVDPNVATSNRKLAITVAAAGAVALTAALTAKSWTPAAQRIFDKARVVTPKDATYLTEGRSGKVWLSNDNKFVIKTSKGKVDMKKFTNEMNTQNALHSAGVSVPKIHNVDAKRGVVMMDYLNGYADSSKIPAANRAPILRKTVSELQKMSALNVSHGDLHPGNIMAKGTDVKIIDFGNAGPIAKNGLSDISNIQLQAKAADPKLFASIVANRKPLEAKISSGKALTQDDFNSFYTRLQRDLKQTSAA
jgi:aminoglycoside phosphotransferase